MANVRQTRYEIEIDVQKRKPRHSRDKNPVQGGVCGTLRFKPNGAKLRSKWDVALITSVDMNESLKRFVNAVGGVIPGQRVWIDTAKNEWGTYDPLFEPKKNSTMEKKSKQVAEAYNRFEFNGEDKTRFTEPETNRWSEDDYDTPKTVLYWMRRLVDENYAAIPENSPSLPTMETVKAMPGRRSLEKDGAIRNKEYKESIKEFEFYVPPEEEKVGA